MTMLRPIYRVRHATIEEKLATARRSGSAGNVFVEREFFSTILGISLWSVVSSHISTEAAEKAMAKLIRKSNKEGANHGKA
jgi:1,2-phenylacetyl-CoA epoxidase PaaB subunit